MKVLVLSQYYDPEPVPKAAELARALRDAGHEVRAITGFPNYPKGKLYPGYDLGLLRRENIDGIPVSRTFEYPYHGRSVLRRLVNFWSFALSAPLASLFMPRADVMYVWHPPLSVGVAAWLISRLRGIPFVYDVQDIWPESAIVTGMLREGFMVRAMYRLEKFIYRRAAHVLCVTEGARQNLIGKGVPPEKVTVMHHWIDEGIFSDVPLHERDELRARRGWSEDFVVLFAGNLGMMQGLDTVVRAGSEVRPGERIRFVFVGDGADLDRLQVLARELGTGDRVEFVERQPMTEMPRYFAAADALLVHLKQSELCKWVIPTKTLAYLAAGKPIVMAMEGAAADLVRDAGAGTIVPPDEPKALVEEIRRIAALPIRQRETYGTSGRKFLLSTMTRDRVIPQYEDVLRRAARR
jgi:glycosyltransferase involved in cell wall biosynthesis